MREPNPFAGEEAGQVASEAYRQVAAQFPPPSLPPSLPSSTHLFPTSSLHRYLKWNLKEDIGLVARCEYDAVMPTAAHGLSFINIKALNEWDPKVAMLVLPELVDLQNFQNTIHWEANNLCKDFCSVKSLRFHSIRKFFNS